MEETQIKGTKLMDAGEQHLCEWQFGGGGSFFFKLFEAISVADGSNQARLARAFPEEVTAYRKFATVPGYWDALEAAYRRGEV